MGEVSVRRGRPGPRSTVSAMWPRVMTETTRGGRGPGRTGRTVRALPLIGQGPDGAGLGPDMPAPRLKGEGNGGAPARPGYYAVAQGTRRISVAARAASAASPPG